jgi:hypothetical protein
VSSTGYPGRADRFRMELDWVEIGQHKVIPW